MSDCNVCSASALPSCLKSLDTLNYAKFLPVRTNEPKVHTSSSLLSLSIADGYAVPAHSQTLPQLHTTFRDSFDKTTCTENTVYLSHDTMQSRAGLTHHNRDTSSTLPAPVWGFCGKEMKRVKGKNGQHSQNYQDDDNHGENCKMLFQCSHSLSLWWLPHHPHSSPAAILLP